MTYLSTPLARKIDQQVIAESIARKREENERAAKALQVRLANEAAQREQAAEYTRQEAERRNKEAQERADNEPAKPTRRDAIIAIHQVARSHGVTVEDIIGPTRTTKNVAARQEAIANIALSHWHYSTIKIGQLFGGRDHTTVLHSISRECVRRGVQIRGYTPEEAAARLCRRGKTVPPSRVGKRQVEINGVRFWVSA